MPEPSERISPPPRRVREALYFPNLLLILVLGVSTCAWALANTDWFPAIGGVLALGGAFSWVAFVSGVLPGERKEQFQKMLEQRVLCSQLTTVVVVVAGVAGAALALGTASVSISSLQDTPALVTWYAHASDTTGDTLDVQPRTAQRWPVWVGYSGARPVRLLVQGLPDLVLDAQARERRSVSVPYSFLRPVLIVRPSARLIDLFIIPNLSEGCALRIEIGGRSWRVDGYTGRPVWIGCTDDVELPQRVRDAWSAERVDRGADEVRRLWSSPMSLAGERTDLEVGQRVKVSLVYGPDASVFTSVYVVRRVARLADFPQVEVLDAK